MRPDFYDAPEPERPVLLVCDRCNERETIAGEFLHCDNCGEVLCAEHFAEGDWGPNEGTCGDCVARANNRSIDAHARQEANN